MSQIPLYKCPECNHKLVTQLPLAVLEGDKIIRAYMQHICRNNECQYRDCTRIPDEQVHGEQA